MALNTRDTDSPAWIPRRELLWFAVAAIVILSSCTHSSSTIMLPNGTSVSLSSVDGEAGANTERQMVKRKFDLLTNKLQFLLRSKENNFINDPKKNAKLLEIDTDKWKISLSVPYNSGNYTLEVSFISKNSPIDWVDVSNFHYEYNFLDQTVLSKYPSDSKELKQHLDWIQNIINTQKK